MMAIQEFHLVDKQTGFPIEVCLIDDEGYIPENCVKGWGQDEVFYKPRYDFNKGKWVESLPISEIIAPQREGKVNQINLECQAKIRKGFYFGEDFLGFSDTDQANFNQQLSLLLLDPSIDSVIWKTENNGIKKYSREEFIQACKTGEVHKRYSIAHYWRLKEYILTHSFSTLEEFNSIDFSFNFEVSTNNNTNNSVGA